MDTVNWMTTISRRLRLVMLTIMLVLGVKTVASALAVPDLPSASVQIENLNSGAKQPDKPGGT